MAIRYSGDVEIRVTWNHRRDLYEGSVTSPELRWRGTFRPWRTPSDPRSSEAYDKAASSLAESAERWARSRRRTFELVQQGLLRRVKVTRVFQAPCPCGHLD